MISAFQLDHELSRSSTEVSCHGLALGHQLKLWCKKISPGSAPGMDESSPWLGETSPTVPHSCWLYYTCLYFPQALTVQEIGGRRKGGRGRSRPLCSLPRPELPEILRQWVNFQHPVHGDHQPLPLFPLMLGSFNMNSGSQPPEQTHGRVSSLYADLLAF